MPRPTLAALLALSLAACSLSPLDAARLSLGGASAAYDAVEPRLEAERRADGAACLPPAAPPSADSAPCLAEVRARWAPVRAASERCYRAIVAALALLRLSEAVEAMGGALDVPRLARAVGMAVDAVGALQAAVGAGPEDGKTPSGVLPKEQP